jgi:Mor family transcriptional regulator
MTSQNSVTAERNRAIYYAFEAGESLESLSQKWGLLVRTLQAIIRHERHKIAVSVDDFYRQRRGTLSVGRH